MDDVSLSSASTEVGSDVSSCSFDLTEHDAELLKKQKEKWMHDLCDELERDERAKSNNFSLDGFNNRFSRCIENFGSSCNLNRLKESVLQSFSGLGFYGRILKFSKR